MNYDQRSKHLNTEIGLIIDSPELAQQTATRFEHMVRPENVYALDGAKDCRNTGASRLGYPENGKAVEYTQEPARSPWQRFDLKALSWLPVDREL